MLGDFSEHVLFGIISALFIMVLAGDVFQLNPTESIVATLGLVAGSVIPDIDHKNSYVHRSIRSVLSLFSGIGTAALSSLEFPVSFLLALLISLLVWFSIGIPGFRHRGFTHSLSFAAITGSLSVIIGSLIFSSLIPGVAVTVGVLSHLTLDREFKLS